MMFRPSTLATPGWVIGPHEIGDYAGRISSYLTNSHLFVLQQNLYSSTKVSFKNEYRSIAGRQIFDIWSRPKRIAKYISEGESFIYIGSNSFVFDCHCVRGIEQALIKRSGGKVICLFLGSEIRSPSLTDELSQNIGQDLCTTYLFSGPFGKDAKVKMQETADSLAHSTEIFADLVLNSPKDQITSLKKQTFPPFYYLPDVPTVDEYSKSRYRTGIIKILHAPSSPLAKGTPIVRSVIKALYSEGFVFEYVELSGVSKETIFGQLADVDIVLNEFYSFVPGILGIEAMYFKCALLTSADQRVEEWLPPGANQAWMQTNYWNIFQNLKKLLLEPDLIRDFGSSGFQWVNANYTDEKNKQILLDYFDTIKDNS